MQIQPSSLALYSPRFCAPRIILTITYLVHSADHGRDQALLLLGGTIVVQSQGSVNKFMVDTAYAHQTGHVSAHNRPYDTVKYVQLVDLIERSGRQL